jgi:hypothetical protein
VQLGEKGLHQIQYPFLELPKYAAGADPQALIDKLAASRLRTGGRRTKPGMPVSIGSAHQTATSGSGATKRPTGQW